MGSGAGPHHRMNAEEDDNRIFSKDRWPLPLKDVRFLNVNQNHGNLKFGSSYPVLLISTDPVNYDTSRCNSEVLHLNDPLIIQALTDSLIKPRNLSEQDLFNVGWFVHAEGETQSFPFGLLKAMKNRQATSATSLSEEDLAKARDFDMTVMNHVPYFFQLQIMPLNFPEFWPLINAIDRYKSGESYEKTKWRLAFQKYNEILPGYYNDYLNSYLRHLNAEELCLKQTKQIYLDNNIAMQ
jgi:hypothetical protein